MRKLLSRSILITFFSVFSIIGLSGNASAMVKSDPNTCNDQVENCKDVEPWFYFV